MITFKNVTKKYEDKVVLDKLTIDFDDKGIVCIVGPSGVGKTTIFNLIAHLQKPDEGEVYATEPLSMVFQEDRLLQWSTALENVEVVSDKNTAIKYLTDMQLENDMDKYPSQMSGGMQRRVAIARALAYNKKIILMDEPLKGLETELREKIIRQLIEHSKSRLIVIITHDMREVELFGGKTVELKG